MEKKIIISLAKFYAFFIIIIIIGVNIILSD